jgi:hypothetical protein
VNDNDVVEMTLSTCMQQEEVVINALLGSPIKNAMPGMVDYPDTNSYTGFRSFSEMS